ncbi:hypothetical protein ES703_88274 [subsurface metagenome]
MDLPAISPAIRLLRVLGSPLISMPEVMVADDELMELYDYAAENRLPLFYLETLKKQGKLDKLRAKYEAQTRQLHEVQDKAREIYHLFKSSSIESIIFKTIRPYTTVPTDVDVLLVDSKDYTRAAALVSSLGYQEENERAPGGKHLYPPNGGVFIDLRPEIALSHIVYLDKNKLIKYAIKTRLNGDEVDIFPPGGRAGGYRRPFSNQ